MPVNDVSLRQAGEADIPLLVTHNRRMFEEVAHLQGRTHAPAALQAWEQAFFPYVRSRMADGSVIAWLIEVDGVAVCSAAIAVVTSPPSPRNPSGRYGLLFGMYTEPAYRRRGLAQRVVQAAVEWCRAEGLRWVSLFASDAGRPLYEGLGFGPTSQMRLDLG
jgi:GNAT superfamily N-acetyltransferase